MPETSKILHHCLYFTANALSRVITRMAEQEFMPTGLSPSHAFLMMLVADEPGIAQKRICEQLHLAPSTITRFVDSLAHRGYLKRKNNGKAVLIYPTESGNALSGEIAAAWKRLYRQYSEVLGEEAGVELTSLIDKAARKLEV